MSKLNPVFFIDGGKVGVMIGEHKYFAPTKFTDKAGFTEIERYRVEKSERLARHQLEALRDDVIIIRTAYTKLIDDIAYAVGESRL